MNVHSRNGNITSIPWIRAGWGDNLDPEFSENENFHIDYGGFTRPTNTYLETAQKTITDIVKKYPPPYYLMLSGGADSQTMLWAWMNSKVPFIPVTFIYSGQGMLFNDYDFKELKEFYKNHKITNYEFINLDIIEFLENDLNRFATLYQCTSPQLCTHMKMVTHLDNNGTKIFSGNFGDCHYTYTIFGLDRFAIRSEYNVIPFFLLYDKEIASHGSFSKNRSDQDTYLKKIKHLQYLKIPVMPQPKKQTGFEKIKDFYDLQTDKVTVRERIRYSNLPSKRLFDIMFRYRFMKKIPYCDEIVYLGRYFI